VSGLRWLRAGAMAVLLLATLGTSASAGAASPPRGALVIGHGRGFCLGRSCIALRGFGRAARNAQDSNTIETLLSPDGRFMYVYGGSSPALAVLARDRRTGAVRQLPGRDGCVTSHPVSGCELVRRLAKTFDWALSADGSTLGLLKSPDNPYGRLLFAPNRRTGALRLVGASKHCVAALDGPCQHLRGISFRTGVASSGPHTLLVFGIDGRGGGTLAVLTRPSSGARWRQSTGPAGCFNEHGVAGCTKLPCLSDAPALTATSNDRRHFYVAGGDTDPEDTGVGYLATFVPGARGGLRVVGCSDTGSDKESGFAPAWISTLPHSSTVLVLLVRGNRGDGITWGRMFASTPGAGGALAAPRQITGNLDLDPFGATISLSPDGRTLYGADIGGDGGGLEVFRASPSALTPLPRPWFHAYRPAQNGHDSLAYGASDMVTSPDGRFVYLTSGSDDPTQDRRAPQLQMYRAAP
jgi:hypothetical protein